MNMHEGCFCAVYEVMKQMQNVNLVLSINKLEGKPAKNIHVITYITSRSVDRGLDVHSLMIALPYGPT